MGKPNHQLTCFIFGHTLSSVIVQTPFWQYIVYQRSSMKKLFLFLGLITLLVFACSKGPSTTPTPMPPTDTTRNSTDTTHTGSGGNGSTGNQNIIHLPGPGVYVAGDSFDLSTQYRPWPVYWVNGKAVHLPNAAPASGNGIVVTDSNVYVSCDGIYFGNNVTYWKDTIGIYLADATLINPVANGLTASGKDLYIVGSGYINGYQQYIPLYWKNRNNAVKVATNVYDHAEGRSISVSGSDIYVAGTMPDINMLGTSPPCFWKNGAVTFLRPVSPSSDRGRANSIYVSGSDVYVVGEVYPIGSGSSVGWAVYWKNGVATELTSPTVMSQANGLTVSGSDVYIAGAVFGSDGALHATYWKNGVPTTLDQKYSVATAITVSGNDVYVAGNRSVDSALYWKNGTPVVLGRGRAYAIAVKN
jgi:hypothetical protein